LVGSSSLPRPTNNGAGFHDISASGAVSILAEVCQTPSIFLATLAVRSWTITPNTPKIVDGINLERRPALKKLAHKRFDGFA
jgi:hypothetical protein